jgi:protein SCO1/2
MENKRWMRGLRILRAPLAPNLMVGMVCAVLLCASVCAQDAAPVGVSEKPGATVALDSILRDEEGNSVSLRQLINKPTILTLNYFRCSGICTPLLNGLASALNEFGLQPGRDFGVITVSFDPRDTPEIAHEKRINYLSEMKRQFPPTAWRFLTGTAENTRAVADSVGFGYRAEADQYLHPGVIMVLTATGAVSRYVYGTSFLPADLQMAIQEAAGGQIRPTVSRIMAICYSYDPQKQSYVFDITRTVGALTLLFAGGFVTFLVVKGRKSKRTP